MNANTKPQLKPMLACTAEPGDILPGFLIAPKLDGIRALHHGGALLSRSLKPIPNRHIQSMFSGDCLDGLDGELIFGDPTAADVFRQTTSAVMSHAGEPEVTFHLFDDFTRPGDPFSSRLERLQRRANELAKAGYPVKVVAQIPVSLANPLDAVEAAMLEEGYEGIVARRPDAAYKYGRSTKREAKLLKLKRFSDSEAVILGAVELMRNENEAKTNRLGHTERSSEKAGLTPGGMLGALNVKDIKSGIEFSLGSGFDADTRRVLWSLRSSLPGKIVTYKHFPVGVHERPRFPTFKAIRDFKDVA